MAKKAFSFDDIAASLEGIDAIADKKESEALQQEINKLNAKIEQLSQGAAVTTINPKDLTPSDYNMYNMNDDERYRYLMTDLKERKESGIREDECILNPIIITEKNGKNIILSGHRRTKAALALGFTRVPVKKITLTSELEQLNIIAREENTKRKPNRMDIALMIAEYEKAIERNLLDVVSREKLICENLGVSANDYYISKKLLRLDPIIQKAYQFELVPTTLTEKLARKIISLDEQPEEAAKLQADVTDGLEEHILELLQKGLSHYGITLDEVTYDAIYDIEARYYNLSDYEARNELNIRREIKKYTKDKIESALSASDRRMKVPKGRPLKPAAAVNTCLKSVEKITNAMNNSLPVDLPKSEKELEKLQEDIQKLKEGLDQLFDRIKGNI